MKSYIYVLKDPTTNEVRYVGKTVNIDKRFSRHCECSKNSKAYSVKWIRSLKPLKPKIEIIEECFGDSWVERECFWIKHFSNLGFRLTNLTLGGEGRLGSKQTDDTKIKISMKKLGVLKSEETKAKMSAAGKVKVFTEQHRANLSKSLKGIPCSTKGVPRTEEVKRKISESNRNKKRSEEQIQNMKLRNISEKTRKQMSESHKNVKHSEETKEKMRLSQRNRRNKELQYNEVNYET